MNIDRVATYLESKIAKMVSQRRARVSSGLCSAGVVISVTNCNMPSTPTEREDVKKVLELAARSLGIETVDASYDGYMEVYLVR